MIPPDDKPKSTPIQKLQLAPGFVYEQWTATERRRKHQRRAMKKAKYAYESRMWRVESNDDNITASAEEGPITASGNQIVVEVSRMPTIIQTITGYLFPRSPKTVITPDVDGRGDPAKAQLAINRWFTLNAVHKKASSAVGQSLLYRGSAIKFGLDLTKRLPQDRVWAKTVPWWDLVLDWDVQDVDEARFYGHSYWEDKAVIERRFGKKIPDTVNSTQRSVYFETAPDGYNKLAADTSGDGRFVHILEWYNLIDDFEIVGADGEKSYTKGVFEVYFIDDLCSGHKAPFIQQAMPFSHADGEPCVPIIPLIFDNEKEHPFRGIAFSDRIYPQCYELALMRTAFANGLRRNARVLFMDKESGITENDVARIVKGEDGVVAMVERAPGRSWDDVAHAFTFPPQTQDYSLYENAVERDLSQGANAASFTRGEASGSRTTAYEVKQMNSYMENHFGELARIKDAWLSDVAKTFLRVLITAMTAPALLAGDADGKPDSIAYVEGPKKQRVVVTVDDLDGDFDINIVDAASTPMTRESRRQDMMLLLPALMELWAQVEAGNPMAVTLLRNVIDLYDLPADFDYRHLMELKKEMEADKPPPPPPPQEAAPGEGPTVPSKEEAMRAVAEMPPERRAKAEAILANMGMIPPGAAPGEPSPQVPPHTPLPMEGA